MSDAKKNGTGVSPTAQVPLNTFKTTAAFHFYAPAGIIPKKVVLMDTSQVKFLITDKHILRFAKNNRAVASKAFCLIVITPCTYRAHAIYYLYFLFLVASRESQRAASLGIV